MSKLNRIQHFEWWLRDVVGPRYPLPAGTVLDEVDEGEQAAYETGQALVLFYREIVKIATGDEGTWADVAELFSAPGIRDLEE